MWAREYFPGRYFAPRYWPCGVDVVGPLCFAATQLVSPGAIAQQYSYAGDSDSQIVGPGSTVDQITTAGDTESQIVGPGVSVSKEGCC
jgi:hypothetical protein